MRAVQRLAFAREPGGEGVAVQVAEVEAAVGREGPTQGVVVAHGGSAGRLTCARSRWPAPQRQGSRSSAGKMRAAVKCAGSTRPPLDPKYSTFSEMPSVLDWVDQ